MEKKKDGRSKPRPLVKCPYCDYTCHGTQPLGRHIAYSHPDKSRDAFLRLRRSTVVDILSTVVDWLRVGDLTDAEERKLLKMVKGQKTKLKVILLALAVEKVVRLARLHDKLSTVDETFLERITKESLKSMTTEQLRKLQGQLESSIGKDTKFLQEIVAMAESKGDVLSELLALFQTKEGRAIVAASKKSSLPQAPVEREVIRNLLRAFTEGQGGATDPEKLLSEPQA